MPADLHAPLDQLPDPLPIPAAMRPFHAELSPPGSKSLTNRALLLAALSDGPSTLIRPLVDAEDAQVMASALAKLGVAMVPEGEALRVGGLCGRWQPGTGPILLDARNSGTTARFLAAAAILSPVPVTIDGDARMRQRPIGELIEALRQLGATCEYLGEPSCPPVRIEPPRHLPSAALLTLGTTLSSQVVSALLLIAPFLPCGLTLKLAGPVTSRSYIQMTLALLDRLGATVRTTEDLRVIRVTGVARRSAADSSPPRVADEGGSGAAPPGEALPSSLRLSVSPSLPAFSLPIEPDASSATYFWAAAALVPHSSVTIRGLSRDSLQGDARFPEILQRMGAAVTWERDSITVRGSATLAPILADLSDLPDAAPTLAAVACFATAPSILRGLRTLRHKESDRLAALATELGRIGVEAHPHSGRDALTITPPPGGLDTRPNALPVIFDTYRDHRMAMALALIGLRRPNTSVRDPACVGKTYPRFWTDLATATRA